jgi:hypothetical protein
MVKLEDVSLTRFQPCEKTKHRWRLILQIAAVAAVSIGSFSFGFADEALHTADEKSPRESTSLPARALSKAQFVFDHTQQNHYFHSKGKAEDQVAIDGSSVSSDTDCSGFVSFVVKSVGRLHYAALVASADGRRPRAGNYAEFFAGLSPSKAKKGWLGISSIAELRPGDLIAWESPRYEETHKGNSGHVMIVAAPPEQVVKGQIEGEPFRYISVPVIDSSSVTHFPPEQLPPLAHQSHRDGVGKGCIRIILNANDHPIGYWEGSYWGEGRKEIRKPTSTEKIYFARLVSLRE